MKAIVNNICVFKKSTLIFLEENLLLYGNIQRLLEYRNENAIPPLKKGRHGQSIQPANKQSKHRAQSHPMAALDKILFWAQKEKPAWQADAVRRFLLCESLSIADKNGLYLMMKVHEKLLDASPEVPKAVMPSMEGLSGSAKPGDTISMLKPQPSLMG